MGCSTHVEALRWLAGLPAGQQHPQLCVTPLSQDSDPSRIMGRTLTCLTFLPSLRVEFLADIVTVQEKKKIYCHGWRLDLDELLTPLLTQIILLLIFNFHEKKPHLL